LFNFFPNKHEPFILLTKSLTILECGSILKHFYPFDLFDNVHNHIASCAEGTTVMLRDSIISGNGKATEGGQSKQGRGGEKKCLREKRKGK
jgi:hypothetical protein